MRILLAHHHLLVARLACASLTVALVTPLSAQQWLTAIPSPATLLQGIHSADPVDLAARREAALQLFRQLIITRDGNKYRAPSTWPPAVAAREREYSEALRALAVQIAPIIDTTCVAPGCPVQRFSRLVIASYGSGTAFQRDLLGRHFSRQWLMEYAATGAAIDLGLVTEGRPPRQAASTPAPSRNLPDIRYVLIALALLMPGVFVMARTIRSTRRLTASQSVMSTAASDTCPFCQTSLSVLSVVCNGCFAEKRYATYAGRSGTMLLLVIIPAYLAAFFVLAYVLASAKADPGDYIALGWLIPVPILLITIFFGWRSVQTGPHWYRRRFM